MLNSPDVSRTLKFAYPLALALIVSPLLELIVRIWPLQLHLVQWRFQAEVGVINTTGPMLVGLLVLGAVAWGSESEGAMKLTAAISALFAAILLPVLVLLFLDSTQVSQMAQSNLRGPLRNNVIVALLRGLFAVVAGISLAIGLWRAASALDEAARRPGSRRTSVLADDEDGLLVSPDR